jgi:hypothetical protein
MTRILIFAGALVALALVRTLIPLLVARVFGRAIGSHAIAKQPDQIHLHHQGEVAWNDPRSVFPLSGPLLQRGFQDAGVYRIRELPDVTLQLLVKSNEDLMAIIYEHAAVGHWVEIACRYRDGGSFTISNSRPTGLAPRPNHIVVHAPGLESAALYDRARAERPHRPLESVSTFNISKMFEEAWAESIAYRKQTGISADEVANVARNRKVA